MAAGVRANRYAMHRHVARRDMVANNAGASGRKVVFGVPCRHQGSGTSLIEHAVAAMVAAVDRKE